ncbi:MAG TPA: hypothetical protein VNM92_13975 [Thermoanaerobaculia bacterium]|nr:hypothetical protein [Thermoanaerobaculia bacterium]
MDLNKGRRTITSTFQEPLHQRGFSEAKRLTFTRGTRDRIEIIAFGLRKAKVGSKAGHICFGVGVGVRFEAIERALRNKNTDDRELFPTVGLSLHLLRPERKYTEWCFDDTNSPSMEVISDVDQYAVPFFDRYQNIDDVRSALVSEDPRSWFTLSPAERREMLDAIATLQSAT